MSQTILSVAYPLTEVGADAAGGSEQILTILDKELVRRGYRSLVLAAKGSRVAGQLIGTPSHKGPLTDEVRSEGRRAHRERLMQTLERYPVDLVHMHSLDFHAYLPPSDIPVLSTLHLPPDWYPGEIFQSRRANFHLNCVSSSQMRCCPKTSRMQSVIPNGIRLDDYTPVPPRKKQSGERYVLGLGRICPEKGFHLALDAAKMAGVDMILAGEIFPYAGHLTYFRKEIAPRLDKRRRFIGPVGLRQKRKLLAQAQCLLVPSLVEETSSLVSMEALASGTPVVAFSVGALPEVVEHGRTGLLVRTAREMAKAIGKAAGLKSADCRSAAESRFSAQDMSSRYLNLYERLLSGHRYAEESRIRGGLSWLLA